MHYPRTLRLMAAMLGLTAIQTTLAADNTAAPGGRGTLKGGSEYERNLEQAGMSGMSGMSGMHGMEASKPAAKKKAAKKAAKKAQAAAKPAQ